MLSTVNSSQIPYANYPHNAVGSTPVTKDIASLSYDTQKPMIAKQQAYFASDRKQNLTWPIVGIVTSFLSLLAIRAIKRH